MYEIKYRNNEQLRVVEDNILDMIPLDWEYKSSKYIVSIIQTGTTPSTSIPKFFDGNINWFNPRDLDSEILTEANKKIADIAIKSNQAKIFPGDSTLIVGIGATAGKTAYLTCDSSFNQQITGIYSKMNYNKFLYYLFRSYSSEFLKLANYTTLPILNNSFFKGFKMGSPLLKEQQKIANFLDIKTTQFDDIIAKKEQLIKKIDEAKNSLISEVVTGKVKIVDGQLVPRDASEMKDSGVEWLGMVPSYWTKFRMKDISKENKYSFVDGPFGSDLKSDEYVDEGIPLIQLNNIRNGKHVFNKMNYITERKFLSLRKHSAYPGEVVFAKMAEPVARCCKVSNDYDKYTIVADCIKMKAKDEFDVDALVYFINSDYVRNQAEILARGTTRVRINLGNLKELLIFLPSKVEQVKIKELLDCEINQIENIIRKTNEQMIKLNKAKQSLISEAVTGKIDLRDWEIIEEGELQ